MIRSVLIALGLSAGAAQGQGLGPSAPILEACGGTRLVLEAEDTPSGAALETARDVVSARMAHLTGAEYDFADVSEGAIVVSVPDGLGAETKDVDALAKNVSLGFHRIDEILESREQGLLSEEQAFLPDAFDPVRSYVIVARPFVDNSHVAHARLIDIVSDRSDVVLDLTPDGSAIFAKVTGSLIGEPIAIVLHDEVLSTPVVQARIDTGSLILTGGFPPDDAMVLAASLGAGVLPFDLAVTAKEVMDGSDPSADFCP